MHPAEHLPDDSWLALLRCKQGDPFSLQRVMQINFGQLLKATVFAHGENNKRLWKLPFSKARSELIELLYRIGQPVQYEYISAPWELDYYQTVYSMEPGSVQISSAGRVFTLKLLFDLKRMDTYVAHIILHIRLSSHIYEELDGNHPGSEEEYFISKTVAEKIDSTHRLDGRVIAIGTMVVRVLESASESNESLDLIMNILECI